MNTEPKLPNGVQIIRQHLFRHPDMSQARLQIRTNGRKWSVVRYLPAGMDFAPDSFTFHSATDADTNFGVMADWLAGKGFTIEKEEI